MASASGENLFTCEGLVVALTGGGTGLGAAMAKALEANGATVYIIGRRKNKLEEVASQAKHGRIFPLQGDVTSRESLKSVTDHIKEKSGYVNLLIANSGIVGPANTAFQKQDLTVEQAQEEFWKIPPAEFNNVFNVNVTAVHYTAVAFLHLLDAGNKQGNVQQTSQIIITSSIGAFSRGFAQASLAYNTSKAATTHLTKSLAAYLIRFKIRVNAIAPGAFPSDMLSSVAAGKDLTLDGSLPETWMPMRRLGRRQEIEATVLYLAGPGGAYCSGSISVVDGGRLGNVPGATY